MEALNDNIIIKIIDAVDSKKSKIIIPDTAKPRPTKGLVVAVSKEIKDKGDLAKDDTVYFPSFLGTETEVEGKTYTVLSYKDILLRIPKKK